jgi:hypothetical protein
VCAGYSWLMGLEYPELGSSERKIEPIIFLKLTRGMELHILWIIKIIIVTLM